MKNILKTILPLALLIIAEYPIYAKNVKALQCKIEEACATFENQKLPCLNLIFDKSKLESKYLNQANKAIVEQPVFNDSIPFFDNAKKIDRGDSYEFILGIRSDEKRKYDIGIYAEIPLGVIFRQRSHDGRIVYEDKISEKGLQEIKRRSIYFHAIITDNIRFISFEIKKYEVHKVKLYIKHLVPIVAKHESVNTLKLASTSTSTCNLPVSCMENYEAFTSDISGVFQAEIKIIVTRANGNTMYFYQYGTGSLLNPNYRKSVTCGINNAFMWPPVANWRQLGLQTGGSWGTYHFLIMNILCLGRI